MSYSLKIKNKLIILKNKKFFWNLLDKITLQGGQFFFGILIARLLLPETYGTFAIVTIIYSFGNIIIDAGLGKSIIQNKKNSNIELNSIYWANFLLSILVVLIIFSISDLLESYLEFKNLSIALKISSSTIIISSLIVVPSALLLKQQNFKILFMCNAISIMISGITGYLLAANGFGIYSLLTQLILIKLVFLLSLFFLSKWTPKLIFSKRTLLARFGFTSKLLLSALLEFITNIFTSLLIGKNLNGNSLGIFNRANSYSLAFSSFFTSFLFSIFFPKLSKLNSELNKINDYFIHIFNKSVLLIIPICVLLSLISKDLILLLLGIKWSFVGDIFSILILTKGINILGVINTQYLHAIGDSKTTLSQDFFKNLVIIFSLLISFSYGLIWIAVFILFSSIICYYINTFGLKKYVNFSFNSQFTQILSIFLPCYLTSFFLIKILELIIVKQEVTLLYWVILKSVIIITDYILLFKILNKWIKKSYLTIGAV